jgi:hypothetical protein
MASMILSGDTSGAVTVTVPAVAGTNTITLPAATGTVMVSGNMPAFSAYATTATSLVSTVSTKLLFDTEEYDTNNNFASSRFTPTVAGYYVFFGGAAYATAAAISQLILYKNGSLYKRLSNTSPSAVSAIYGSGQVYCNGTTDYVELYLIQTAATQNTFQPDSTYTYFQGAMVRAA